MVHIQHEHMFLRRQANQPDAQQRALSEVKGPARFFGKQPLQFSFFAGTFAEIPHDQSERRWRPH